MFKIREIPRTFWRLSAMEFLFWVAAALGAYLSVFLQKKGYGPDQVGIVLAVSSVVSILASPFWGMAADKIRSVRKILFLCLLIGAVLWAIVPVSAIIAPDTIMLMFIIILLGTFFRSPINSLMDSLVIRKADAEKIEFSHVRLWGSFSFAIMCFALCVILPVTGVELSFYLYGVAFTPLLIIIWRTKETESTGQSGRRTSGGMGYRRLFKNYHFLTYLVFLMLYAIPVNTFTSFLPFLINEAGDDAAQMGLVIGYNAILEIPMLFLIRPLKRKIPPLPFVIGMAALLYCLGAFLFSRADSLVQIMFIQTLHGLGSGLFIGSGVSYVYSLVPRDLSTTAYAVCGSISATSAIIGNSMGGFLIAAFGIHSYYLISSFIMLFAVFFFMFTLVIGKKFIR